MAGWNEDQIHAIETTDKGVVVSAAAGSGKMAVLIERTIRMLSDPHKKIPADKLLAVTFTVDAASQLRQKLAAAFEERLRSSADPEEKKWLRLQQDRLPLARISTINSFCLDLVKSNLNEFEFEEGVRIIDEHDAEIVLDQAFTLALDRLAETDKASFSLLYGALGGKISNIKKYGRKLYEFLRSLPFPDEWFGDNLARMTDKDAIAAWLDTVLYINTGLCEKAMKLNERARTYIKRFPKPDKALIYNTAVLERDLDAFNEFMKASGSCSWELIRMCAAYKFDTIKRKPAKNSDYSPEHEALFKEIGDIRDESKNIFQQIGESLEKLGSDLYAPMERSAEVFKALRQYASIANEIAYAEKLRRNALEFSDVEIMALTLLVKNEGGRHVRTELANETVSDREYEIILIDEFQDVNDLQELIFRALSDTDDLTVLGRNGFVVGDVKQSIYRFRLSNPRLFTEARRDAADPENSDRLSLVELRYNYRSRSNILGFVNLVFSQLMSEEIGELEYTDSERLRLGAEYPDADPACEVIFVDSADASDEDTSAPTSADENYAIAARIRELIDQKAPVTDLKTKTQRPCRAGDFCVLYRSGDSCDSLSDALAAVGLRASSEKGSGYLRSREISLMLSLLKVIDNPMRDIPMAAVMLSPVMGFTADELARIRLRCKREKGSWDHLYQIISAAGQQEGEVHSKESSKLDLGDKALEQKCSDAKKLISRLGFYSAGMSLTRLIRRILDETELLAAASLYENSMQKRANLRLLLDYASSYEENSDGSVAGFIRYLESVADCGEDLIQAVTTVEDGDSVIVKTIHSSKGLEFPFVFLCGLSKKFRLTDLNEPLLLDEYSGAGLTVTDMGRLTRTETVAHAALSVVGRAQLLSEELRLLYVALTRAKERLFIPIVFKYDKNGAPKTRTLICSLAEEISQAGGVTPRIVRESSCYLEWLTAALLCSKGREPLLRRFGISCLLPTVDETAEIEYREYTDGRASEDTRPDFYAGVPDEAQVEALLAGFRYKQEHSAAPAASKLTVTEIVSMQKEKQFGEKDPEFYPSLPRLSDELEKLDSAQRGTCTHLFMELADYAKAEVSVRDELDELVRKGFFTKKEASGVYVSAIEKFFGGEFYQRVKASDCVLREKKFLAAYDDLGLGEEYSEYLSAGSMLQGVADCIFSEGDGYVLIDYKTDNVSDVSQLYTYKTQLELYKAALDLILDKPVKACYIYSFRLNEGVEIAM